MDYYQKLKENFPAFNATLQLDDRQQKSLDSLLGFTEGALTSCRGEVAKADTLYSQFNEKIRDQKRSEALNTAKSKSIGSIKSEFEKIENRVLSAKSMLHAATHLAKPADSSEALLRYLQQKEIRDDLAALPLAKRIGVVADTVQKGEGSVLHAIEDQPVTSDLVPKDILERSLKTYGDQVAPKQSKMVSLAEQDAQGALLIKNLASVEIGRMAA